MKMPIALMLIALGLSSAAVVTSGARPVATTGAPVVGGWGWNEGLRGSWDGALRGDSLRAEPLAWNGTWDGARRGDVLRAEPWGARVGARRGDVVRAEPWGARVGDAVLAEPWGAARAGAWGDEWAWRDGWLDGGRGDAVVAEPWGAWRGDAVVAEPWGAWRGDAVRAEPWGWNGAWGGRPTVERVVPAGSTTTVTTSSGPTTTRAAATTSR